ncbi:MAG: hypothetical protein ACI85Q_001484 [Salibacteraceae bacterium]|jgi:hypothetical protein
MTTRWEKGEEHLKLIVEGLNTKKSTFETALNIDLDANILIDLIRIDKIDGKSVKYLNEFAGQHKLKNFSIIAASITKIPGLQKMEVVSTVSEARDLIFLEITERELGFFGEEEV